MKSRALNDLRVARLRLKVPEKLPALNREAIRACVLIVTERERFPELGSGKGQRRFLFGAPNRERHLSRLEAISKLLQCLLAHMNLVTLRAGKTRRDGTCDAIRTLRPRAQKGRVAPKGDSTTSIEAETGLNGTRVKRALRDLRAAGWITSHQPKRDYRDKEGERRWRSYPTVHTITRTCLTRLGIDLAWLGAQGAAAAKREVEGPRPLVNVRLKRETQRIVRAQRIAAKRAAAPRPTEAQAAAALRKLAERQRHQE